MGDQGQELARDALERVCSGSDASAAEGVYSRSFRDHVNGRDYVGHEGIRQSLALYQLAFETATYRSRSSTSSQRATRLSPAGSRRATTAVGRSKTWGIVISRVEDGEIAEDWAASDSLEIARQLGLRRTLLLGVRLAAESRTNLAPPSLDIG